jgi:integrase/recombinase XerD
MTRPAARPGKGAASAHLIETFLDMMSAERGAGANTLTAYRRDLLDFAGHLSSNGADPARCGRDAVRAFLTSLSRSGVSASTQARKLSALRQFYGFLYGEGLRDDDPTQTIAAPQGRRPLPKVLSGADLEAMLAVAAEDQTPAGLRLTLIVEMLYGGGLRVSELAGLTLAAVRGRESFIRITGKGGKERLSPLSPAARQALDAYLDVRAAFVPHDDKNNRYLFASRGRGGAFTSCSRRWRSGAAWIPPRCRRMCCATPSPPIWWKAGRTCAACRPCWAMPTSPPPRFIPMWRGII